MSAPNCAIVACSTLCTIGVFMLFKRIHHLLVFLWIVLVFSLHPFSFAQTSWRQAQRQDTAWYGTDEAIRIADQVLLYQKDCGGWGKNIDMAAPLSEKERVKVIKSKPDRKSTGIDNGATYSQIRYLANVYFQTKEERFKTAVKSGVYYLLAIQYENGGFPQFPFQSGYKLHITYNDNAMIGALDLLKDIADQEPPFTFIDDTLRLQTQHAVGQGIECILNTQIIVNGKKTVWCAQHDRETLKPAPARSYEKISLSGAESVRIVRFLMRIEQPNDAVKDAIESAIHWFDAAKLTGIKVIRKQDSSLPRGYDKVVVRDENAEPLWARFYEIGTNKPIFCGRDGIIKETLAEIEHERRVGYSWYTDNPEDLFNQYYPKWKKKQI